MHDGPKVAPADAYMLSTLDDDLVSDYLKKSQSNMYTIFAC